MLDIRVLGDPILRERTRPVDAVSDDMRQLAADMLETMHAATGIGLAAPQVGRTERVFVMDVDDEPYVMFNPEIVERDGLDRAEEGCLSIPEIFGDVDRATRVVVRALDENGEEFTLEAFDLAARCIQHEIDHLDGKLFIDYLSLIRRKLIARKWEKESEKYPGFVRRVDATTRAGRKSGSREKQLEHEPEL